MIQGRLLRGLILGLPQHLDGGRTGSVCAAGRMIHWRTALPTKELDYGSPENLWTPLDGVTPRDFGRLRGARVQSDHRLRPRCRWKT